MTYANYIQSLLRQFLYEQINCRIAWRAYQYLMLQANRLAYSLNDSRCLAGTRRTMNEANVGCGHHLHERPVLTLIESNIVKISLKLFFTNRLSTQQHLTQFRQSVFLRFHHLLQSE